MGPNEIKMIEKLAEKLEEWADNPSYDHSPTFIRFAPDLGQKDVIHWLLVEKHGLGGKVQEGFKVLQEKVCDLNSWSAKPITEAEYNEEFCPRIDEVKEIADDLVETLRFIIEKPAEAERNTAPGKGGRIGNFFWKLYEKTLKVIVDAVLERWCPK